MNIIIDRTWKQGSLVNIEDLRGLTFQAEAQAHTFRISGVDAAGNPITLTGTPSGVMLRPDNTDVALTCAVSDGKVTATLPAECYDVPGRVGITIYLTSNSQKVCIYSAITSVNRTSSGTASPGTTSSVVDLVNAINAAISSIPASYSNLLADIAPTYSDSALYAVGQYAWYDGDLKRCIVPITTSESYTAAHWTSAVLGQDVCDLKSALNETSLVSLNHPIAITGIKQGAVYDNRITSDTSTRIRTDPIPVAKGMKLQVFPGIVSTYWYAVFSPSLNNWVGTTISDVGRPSKTINIEDAGFVVVCFRKTDSSATISPSDYDGTVRIVSGVNEQNTERSFIRNQEYRPIGNGNLNDYSGIQINSSTTTRIVTDFIPVLKGEVVTLWADSNSKLNYFYWKKYNTQDCLYKSVTNWPTGEITIDIDYDGYIAVAFCRKNGNSLTLSDYHGRIIINSPLEETINKTQCELIHLSKKYEYNASIITIRGYYVANDGVSLTQNNNVNCSDYIDISSNCGTIAYLRTYAIGLFGILFYNENKAFLFGDVYDSTDAEKEHTVCIPQNAKYARFNLGVEKQLCLKTQNRIEGLALHTEIKQENMVQVNNGQDETAASAIETVFDKKTGKIYGVYLAGDKQYGERTGWIRMCIFPASQPTNAKWVTIEKANTVTEPNITQVDDDTIRIIYRTVSVYKYKDYTISTDTVGEEHNMTFDGQTFYWSVYDDYVTSEGLSGFEPAGQENYGAIFTSRLFSDSGKKYGAVTGKHHYPVLVESSDDFANIEPFAVYPYLTDWEFTYVILNDVIYALSRRSNKIVFATSSDNGETWTNTDIDIAIWSRPDMFVHNDEVYFAYNYNAGRKASSFPASRYRNAILLNKIDDGEIVQVASITDYHGLVYERIHYFFNDAYMAFSQSTIGLESMNTNTDEESKEVVVWSKIIADGEVIL